MSDNLRKSNGNNMDGYKLAQELRKAKFQGKSAAEIVKMNTPPSNELEKKEDAPVIGEGNEGEALKQNIFQKAASFAQAVASKGINNNKAAPTTYSLRVLSCHGDESKGLPPCPKRLVSQKYANSYYCGACGCGDKPLTQLVPYVTEKGDAVDYCKLHFPKVTCPLQMPGFTNYASCLESPKTANDRKKYLEFQEGIDYIKDESNPKT